LTDALRDRAPTAWPALVSVARPASARPVPPDWLERDDEERLTLQRAADRVVVMARDDDGLAWRAATERVSRMRSYVELRLLLGLQDTAVPAKGRCVLEFPPVRRAELLVALGGRLLALPVAQQGLAVKDFLAVDPGPAACALLREIRAAARIGPEGLRQREKGLATTGGAAHAAVLRGDHVRVVARRFGMSGTEALQMLEDAALPDALRAVAAGASAQVVADRLGICSSAGREDLERCATGHAGIAAVRLGECPVAVAQRLGIQSERCVRVLKHQAARRAVSQGRPVHEVARRFDLRDAGSLLGLELLAVDVASSRVQAHGENVGRVAARLGIFRPVMLRRLEQRAASWVGADAVRRGESVESVAGRLGIRTPELVAGLRRVAQARPGSLG
jgi:hypothetical protein